MRVWAPGATEAGPGAAAGTGLAGTGPDPGRPVLLVHGLASNARTWDGVARGLAGLGHPVAAVDQRGHGRSDKPDGGYDFATVCADLVAVLDGLGWRAPLVAGQSWGGNVVLELGIRHPEAVAGIVCVDGGTLELSQRYPTWERCRAALAPPRLAGLTVAEMSAMIRTWHRDWTDEGVAGMLANLEVLDDGTVMPWLSRDRHLTILRHLWEHHPSQRWSHVKIPVLLIPSQMVAGAGIDTARALAAPGLLRVLPFPGADHDVHIQHPAEVASALHKMATEL